MKSITNIRLSILLKINKDEHDLDQDRIQFQNYNNI